MTPHQLANDTAFAYRQFGSLCQVSDNEGPRFRRYVIILVQSHPAQDIEPLGVGERLSIDNLLKTAFRLRNDYFPANFTKRPGPIWPLKNVRLTHVIL